MSSTLAVNLALATVLSKSWSGFVDCRTFCGHGFGDGVETAKYFNDSDSV